MSTWSKRKYGFVYKFLTGLNSRPLYIGSTTNPTSRLNSHFCSNQKSQTLTDKQYDLVKYISVAFVGDEDTCRSIELALIVTLQPPFNTALKNAACNINSIRFVDQNPFYWFTFSKKEFLKDNSVVYGCFETYWRGKIAEERCEIMRSIEGGNDEWEPLIRKYLEDKERVCVKQIWFEAIAQQQTSVQPSAIESRKIGKLLTNTFNWSRSGVERFKEYGPQKTYRKEE